MNSRRYGDYVIELLETSPGRWRARVQRADGRKIKIPVSGNETVSITTGGMERFSAEDAFNVAKEMIDGGGMQ